MDASRGADPPAPSLPRRLAALEICPLTDRSGVHAAGEITLTTRTAWERTLEDLVGGGGDDVHLDLSAVTFVDVAGASAVAFAAQQLGSGRRMVLTGPPPGLRRALEMFWPGLVAIEVRA
ncbi:STAS domain-containing protein [Streptomyces sp. NPDC048479]|uniref:STAS domain-containing protein n=1 Tax=Streptomyces sp. NPDC048479 TaxID=3154725 RepID=UPI00342173B6